MITLAAKHQGSVTAIMRHQEWAFPLELKLFGRPAVDWAGCKLGEWLDPMPYESNTWTNWALKHIGSIYWRMIADTLLANSPDSLKPTIDLRRERNRHQRPRAHEQSEQRRSSSSNGHNRATHSPRRPSKRLPHPSRRDCVRYRSTTFGLAGQEEAFWLYRGVLDPHIRNLVFIGYGSFNFNQLKFSLQGAWLCDMLQKRSDMPIPGASFAIMIGC